jgi:hypothetical protein
MFIFQIAETSVVPFSYSLGCPVTVTVYQSLFRISVFFLSDILQHHRLQKPFAERGQITYQQVMMISFCKEK